MAPRELTQEEKLAIWLENKRKKQEASGTKKHGRTPSQPRLSASAPRSMPSYATTKTPISTVPRPPKTASPHYTSSLRQPSPRVALTTTQRQPATSTTTQRQPLAARSRTSLMSQANRQTPVTTNPTAKPHLSANISVRRPRMGIQPAQQTTPEPSPLAPTTMMGLFSPSATLWQHFHHHDLASVASLTDGTWVGEDVHVPGPPSSPSTLHSRSSLSSEEASTIQQEAPPRFGGDGDYKVVKSEPDVDTASEESYSSRSSVEDESDARSKRIGIVRSDGFQELLVSDSDYDESTVEESHGAVVPENTPQMLRHLAQQSREAPSSVSPKPADSDQLETPLPSEEDETPLLDLALQDFQRSPDEEFDWKAELSPALLTKSRRLDSTEILLPIPSLRQELGQKMISPTDASSQISPHSLLGTMAESPEDDVEEADEDVFGWRTAKSPDDLPAPRPKRRESSLIGNPLLPIPSLREEISRPSMSKPMTEPMNQIAEEESPATKQLERPDRPRVELPPLAKQGYVTSRRLAKRETTTRDAVGKTPTKMSSSPNKPQLTFALPPLAGVTFRSRPKKEGKTAESTKPLASPDSEEEDEGDIGLSELPQCDGKTLLTTISEVPAGGSEAVKQLEAQVSNLLTEKHKLQESLHRMRKPYEERVTPFRDLFEQSRKLREENATYKKEKEEMDKNLAFLQRKVTTIVSEAVEKTQVQAQQVQAANRRADAAEQLVRELQRQLEAKK